MIRKLSELVSVNNWLMIRLQNSLEKIFLWLFGCRTKQCMSLSLLVRMYSSQMQLILKHRLNVTYRTRILYVFDEMNQTQKIHPVGFRYTPVQCELTMAHWWSRATTPKCSSRFDYGLKCIILAPVHSSVHGEWAVETLPKSVTRTAAGLLFCWTPTAAAAVFWSIRSWVRALKPHTKSRQTLSYASYSVRKFSESGFKMRKSWILRFI